jgi:Ca2+-binding EF-hand superfamily protein
MKSVYLSVVLLLTLGSFGVANAEPKKFKDIDVNTDGFLDSAEFSKSGAESPFKEFDENGDGKLSKQEYEDKLAECE